MLQAPIAVSVLPALVASIAPLSPVPVLVQQSDSIHGTLLTAEPAIAALLDPYRGALDSAEVAEVLDERRRWTGFPRTAEQHVLAARLWRRAGEPDLALAELERLLPAERGPLDALERARVLVASAGDGDADGRADRDPGAGADHLAQPDADHASQRDADSAASRTAGIAAWWAACEEIDEATRAEVYRDILPLTTPEEREKWPELAAGAETCGWLRDFWNERAQLMAVTADERLALHYRRLAHAREWYWISRPYFYRAPADYHGRPDGLAMDDRGLVYVRMGRPDSEFHPELSQRFPCWPYWRPGGYRIYCFAGGRLRENVPGRPGTMFYQRYLWNSNLPKSTLRRRQFTLGGGGLREAWERGLHEAEAKAFERHAVVRTRENIDAALERIPDVPEILAGVSLRVETLRFLDPTRRQWEVWTLVSARAGDLRVGTTANGDPALRVGGRYSVLGPEGVRLHELAPVEVPAEAVDDDAGVTLTGVFTPPSGRLPLTVVVEDRNRPPAGNWHRDTINVPGVGGLPQLSDIAVAQSEGGTWTRDGRTFLRVTPAHVTNPDGSIHTYFEVYGVRPGTGYEVEFRLTEEDAAERIWRLQPDDLAFRLAFTAEMEGEIGRHHLRLDLGDTEPGAYVLAVRIQDEDTEAYSLPSVTEIYVAERD